MSKQRPYAVRISGLGEGEHHFRFNLDREFFISFAHPDLNDGKVRAEIVLIKKAGVRSLHFELQGEVKVTCDRCLNDFMFQVTASHSLYLKLEEENQREEDDVILIDKDDHEVDVGQLLYEFIVLAIPVQKIHPLNEDGKSTCDPEMLRKLEAHQHRKLDKGQETDPRWDALKDMIDKKK